VSEKKRGRPRKIEISHWDKKYYSLDPKRDAQAYYNLKQERLFKGFATLFSLAFEREPNQKDVGTVNKAVNAIIDRI
jgi:hypothetical protein